MKCDVADIPNVIGLPLTLFAIVGIATVVILVCTFVCIAWRSAVDARAQQLIDKASK